MRFTFEDDPDQSKGPPDTAHGALGPLRSEIVDTSDTTEAGCTAIDCATSGGGVLQHTGISGEVGEVTRVVERNHGLQGHDFLRADSKELDSGSLVGCFPTASRTDT